MWLLALRTVEWPRIYVSHGLLDPWRANVLKEWGSQLCVLSLPQAPHLTVVACESQFVELHLEQIFPGFPVIMVLLSSPCHIGRLQAHIAQHSVVPWRYITHMSVGGITTFGCWFLMRPLFLPTIPGYPQHSLASIIDYAHFSHQRSHG